ncbi:T9SS type A sorting domain-containing protein [Tamlana sp. 2_MG-2023]|uniref:T9SS type A sorting domain-containing protein n=1 Tax=unclassified Tamlana TaxID=2614803 RepID=UPI0026E2423F|nr:MULTISPECIES: T9SS type A sorting domain-containing protein [unclassified Tamlana]MDO6760348.1 T9SS type A sorting domain-containing protein [Tamlana sp. 2_MG-2023]MDO6789954.1 T9SS type A sorting domain-containing protein [Tamlana sp. 1_MG-2023]
MNYTRTLIALMLCFFINLGYSQTGPGGVGNSSSNGLWLKADNLTLSNSDSVSNWPDASGNSNDASAISGQQPLYSTTSTLNSMPTVVLDGSDDIMTVADADILDGTTGITYFSVLKPKNLDEEPRGILGKRIRFETSADYAYTWFFYKNQNLNLDINTQNNRVTTNTPKFINNTNYILQFNYDGTLSSSLRSKVFNGQQLLVTGNETSSSIINSKEDLVIGALNKNYRAHLGAEIAELIHFNYALSSAERIIVNNYLSAKYNIALTSEDYYKQDKSANGNFDHNVAGIGQASDSSNHTDSQGAGIVRINNPSDLDNDEFLFWGEETKNPTYDFGNNTTNNTEQLNSIWRVSKRGSIDDLTVIFDLKEIVLTGGAIAMTCPNLELIVSSDSNFTSPTTYPLINDTTNHTATANNVNFSDNDYFSIRYANQIVWDGSSFSGGSGSGGAPSNLDSCLKLLVLPGTTATLTEDAKVREIEVLSGASLEVNDGILLQTENRIILNGNLNLLGEAQLIQNHTGPDVNSGSGELTIRQQGTTNLHNYNYWCSPVNNGGTWQISALEDSNGTLNFTSNLNADPSTSPITLSNRWLYTFYGTTNNYYDWQKITENTVLNPGDGFTLKGSGAATTEQEYIFRGMPNSGDYNLVVTSGNDVLMGNPYPSALDANQFINDNLSVIDGTLYFWEHFTTNNSHNLKDYQGGYATYNLMMGISGATPDTSGLTSGTGATSKSAPTANISVAQGFFVTIDSDGVLAFNNGQRTFAKDSDGGSIFYKTTNKKSQTNSDQRTKLWFSFTEPKNLTKILGLGYDANHATYDYDKGYDAIVFDDFRNDAYWVLNGEKLAIQALPTINSEDELPLTVKATDAGNYKFAIEKSQYVPDDLEIYLKDDISGSYHDIKSNPAEITLARGLYENRFSIVFQDQVTLSNKDKTKKAVFVSYDKATKLLTLNNISDLKTIKSITIYDTMGNNIFKSNTPNSNIIDLSNFSDGIYVLTIKTLDQLNVQAIKFIKY